MPKKIGKIWTPIDTSNQQEVEKHPLRALAGIGTGG